MKRRSNLLLYLLLNVLVSAATMLLVLWAWDSMRQDQGPLLPQIFGQGAAPAAAFDSQAPAASLATATLNADGPAASGALPGQPVETPHPTETLPPADQPVIQIVSVVGAGDIDQEVVMLKRVGEGNLRMVGWKLQGEHDNTYVFPERPELTLYKDGAVQVYTKTGTDTVTEVYWNRAQAAWRSGELIRLLDPQGTERASYRVP